ncbi:Hint domain-containing protein [Cereibacter sphaeroides]|nr:Hint domain-containing protein [Cereibacter sphaeroides]
MARPPLPLLTVPSGPGVVDGTALDDLIDGLFTDADGDQVDDLGVSALGNDGDDTLFGGDGADQLWGGDGDDRIEDGAGNDTIVGGAGSDYLISRAGDDLVVAFDPSGPDDFSFNFIRLDGGNDTAFGGAGEDFFAVYDPLSTHVANTDHLVIDGGGDGVTPTEGIRSDFDTIHTDYFGNANGSATLTYSASESGRIDYASGARIDFTEIEQVLLSAADDTVVVVDPVQGIVSGGDGYNTLLLPDPAPGETAPVVQITDVSARLGASGRVTFADGSTLIFRKFDEIICFTAGTLIDTDTGPRAVETLRPGDRVLTRDAGYQPLVWTGETRLSHEETAQSPALAPVTFAAGCLGAGLPEHALSVSPRHRMLLRGARASVMFGAPEVLVPAIDLLGLPGVTQQADGPARYVHVMCAEHQILRAHGAWSESLQLSQPVLDALEQPVREELLTLFPELRQTAARPVLTRDEARVLLAMAD